jgi:hypothetical protein
MTGLALRWQDTKSARKLPNSVCHIKKLYGLYENEADVWQVQGSGNIAVNIHAWTGFRALSLYRGYVPLGKSNRK